MARSQETFNKKEKEKKRLKKKQDKQQRREERKLQPKDDLDDMMAYVDENRQVIDAPLDPTIKRKMVDAASIELGVPKREKEEFTAERNGIVEFFDDSKGFGFIRDKENQEKYFVHVSGLINDVKEGNAVTFELEKGLKGMNAVSVKKA